MRMQKLRNTNSWGSFLASERSSPTMFWEFESCGDLNGRRNCGKWNFFCLVGETCLPKRDFIARKEINGNFLGPFIAGLKFELNSQVESLMSYGSPLFQGSFARQSLTGGARFLSKQWLRKAFSATLDARLTF